MKFNFLAFLAFFFSMNILLAQNDHIYGLQWIGSGELYAVATDIEADSFNLMNEQIGVNEVHGSTGTIDVVGGRYFMLNNRGVTITNIYSGLVTDTIAYPHFLYGIRYHHSTNSLYGLRYVDANFHLIKIDIGNKSNYELASITSFETLYNPTYAMNQAAGIYYTSTSVGVTGIDIFSGAIVDSMSSPIELTCMEYDVTTNNLYGLRYVDGIYIFTSYDIDSGVFVDIDTIGSCALASFDNTAIDSWNRRYFVVASGGILSIDMETGAILDTLSQGEYIFGIDYIESFTYLNLEEAEQEVCCQLYPNPSTGNVQIALNDSYAEINVELRDLQGKLLYTEEFSEQKNLNLAFHFLVEGSYIIHVRAGDKLGLVKFVKQ